MVPEEPEARTAETRAPGKGCNMIALAIVLILLVVFALAAWVNAPSGAPDPIDTGVPPSAPN